MHERNRWCHINAISPTVPNIDETLPTWDVNFFVINAPDNKMAGIATSTHGHLCSEVGNWWEGVVLGAWNMDDADKGIPPCVCLDIKKILLNINVKHI